MFKKFEQKITNLGPVGSGILSIIFLGVIVLSAFMAGRESAIDDIPQIAAQSAAIDKQLTYIRAAASNSSACAEEVVEAAGRAEQAP